MRTPEERFWAKVDKTETCWNWTAALIRGYGQFTVRTKFQMRAHRYAYQAVHGAIDPALVIDHICRNRKCVRIDHLRLVTQGQNTENQNGHRDGRSGHRGVTLHRSGRWRAYATKNGKMHSGGTYADVEDAAEAARQLRLRIHTHNELDRMVTK